MGAIKRFGKAVFLQGWRIVGSYFAWMRKFAKHPEKYPFEVRQKKVRELASKISKSLDIDFIIEGMDSIPDTASVIYGNHLSMMDPLSLVSILEKPTSYISKRENEKVPFLGKVMKDLEGEFLDRDDLKQSLKTMMRVQSDLEKGTKHWVIFPDGTRTKDPMLAMKEFHHGSFRPAIKANVPIVPVAFYGTHSALKTDKPYKKHPVFIKFLKPIMPNQYQGMTTNDVAKMVHDQIQRVISFDLRSRYHKYMSKFKGYRFNEV